jgi:hypothetical protein
MAMAAINNGMPINNTVIQITRLMAGFILLVSVHLKANDVNQMAAHVSRFYQDHILFLVLGLVKLNTIGMQKSLYANTF